MASGGHAPAALAPTTVTPVVPETTADPATAPTPTATVAPAPTPAPTATPEPLPPAATGTGTTGNSGATTAPAG